MAATLSVLLEDDTLVALDRLADRMACPRADLVARVVADYVADDAMQIGKIETGLAAADKGDFATDDEVARVRSKFAPSR